jgi:hypothetical protein
LVGAGYTLLANAETGMIAAQINRHDNAANRRLMLSDRFYGSLPIVPISLTPDVALQR